QHWPHRQSLESGHANAFMKLLAGGRRRESRRDAWKVGQKNFTKPNRHGQLSVSAALTTLRSDCMQMNGDPSPRRALNSAARVTSSHGGSHWFESSSAHSKFLIMKDLYR